jgi:hypothetical protein
MAFELDEFVVHLAAHLFGAKAVTEARGRRLCWSSLVSEREEGCIFLDILFELNFTKKNDTPSIQMNFGSLWRLPDGTATYYLREPVTQQDTDRHFAAMQVHAPSNSGAILAKAMAKALKTPESIRQETAKLTLRYSDLDNNFAPLDVKCSIEDDSTHCETFPISDAMLAVLLAKTWVTVHVSEQTQDEIDNAADTILRLHSREKNAAQRKGVPKTSTAAAVASNDARGQRESQGADQHGVESFQLAPEIEPDTAKHKAFVRKRTHGMSRIAPKKKKNAGKLTYAG